MSSKTTVYLNVVVKYQELPCACEDHNLSKLESSWKDKEHALKDLFEDLRVDIRKVLLLSDGDISLIPTYHTYSPQTGSFYYKIEIKYPSILGVQELIEVDK